ncbi:MULTISPECIES: hypothetical protein [Streptosporangium]|uniref:YD repeat-containing protein n=1 Tax=Streptosporangium brasiliense TaxID=47480 RepID=A0ABT9QXL4_9ACTN|nr:hypothetical protein [Streptosporangium brasiliense]MDP9861717.1 YD repeat-containing protein [Streptosporangium brasiliense]
MPRAAARDPGGLAATTATAYDTAGRTAGTTRPGGVGRAPPPAVLSHDPGTGRVLEERRVDGAGTFTARYGEEGVFDADADADRSRLAAITAEADNACESWPGDPLRRRGSKIAISVTDVTEKTIFT